MKEPWENVFAKLLDYNERHGTVRVPRQDEELGSWVDRQRTYYRMNKLSEEQVALLESVGFEWHINNPRQVVPKHYAMAHHDSQFDEMMAKLRAFKQEHGHCRVPRCYKDSKLANWVKNRRSEKKREVLSKERVAKLDEIGFEWEVTSKKESSTCESALDPALLYGI